MIGVEINYNSTYRSNNGEVCNRVIVQLITDYGILMVTGCNTETVERSIDTTVPITKYN